MLLLSLSPPAYTLPPDLLPKARLLEHVRTALYFGGTAWELLLLYLLLRWGAGGGITGWARRVTARRGGAAFAERPWLAGLLVAPAWLLVVALIELPLGVIAHHVQLRCGLSVEGWAGWFSDWGKGEAINLVIGTLVLAAVFALLRRSPRRWWLWTWVLVQPFVVLGVFLAPVVVDPMFNHFAPLERADPALVARLEQVAKAGGLKIPPDRMFVEDASRRSTGMNAYVTGIGSSKRIVVWDTTIKKLPPEEIMAIYAHEQGHYVLGHIWKGMLFDAGLMLVLFALLAWVYRRAVLRWGDAWHMSDPADWAALPLLLWLATLLGFLSAPALNAFSRGIEHQADVYGQRLLSRLLPNAGQVEVEDFNRLGRAWLETPHPNGFVVWWTYSHPPIARRAEDARAMSEHPALYNRAERK